MDISGLEDLQHQVLWAAFALSVSFGVIAQRTNFCTMGALSDIFNMGNWTRMRMWGMAVGVAMLGFALMAWLGWINPSRTIYSSGRIAWLSAILGGLMFGFGMVLASGCGSKTLVRIGEGSLKSLVVFFIMGLSAYASMRGVTAMLRSHTIDQVTVNLPTGSSVPAWLSFVFGIEPLSAGVLVASLIGGGLVLWALLSQEFRSSANNLLAGLGIGAAVILMWWVTGHLGFVAEHPETLEATYVGSSSGLMQAFSFTSPMARTIDWVISYDDLKILSLGVVTVSGVVVGALAYALYDKSFQWEGFHGTQDTALHLIGATFMGVGGVTAGGCTVGQGLSGLSTLSVASFIAVTGIMLGAVVGLRLQMWLLMRE